MWKRPVRGLRISLAASLTLLLALSACNSSRNASGDDIDPATYFKGKTVRMVLGFAPGGGSDTGMRIIARYWSKYIPGNPNLIVENQEGAAGINASNYVYEQAKNDGLTLLANSGAVWRDLARPSGVRYHIGEMPMIGGVSSNYVTLHSIPGVSKASPQDITKLGETVDYAGVAVDSPPDAVAKIPLQILGLKDKVKFVYGYEGSAEAHLALEQKEASIMTEGVSSYVSRGPEETIKPLWQAGMLDASGKVVRHASVPDLPTPNEVIKAATGSEPSGALWDAYKAILGTAISLSWVVAAPPDTSEAILGPLREGFKKLINDPDFKKDLEKAAGSVLPVYGPDEATAIIKTVAATPPDTIKQLLEILRQT